MEKQRKPRVLLTGFTPFGGERINPALEAVNRVRCPEAELRILEVPTVFGDSARLVTAEMDAFRPDVVLCVGQAAGRSAEILLRIVDAGDDRNADAERPAAFLEPFEVFQNRLIGHACIVPVLLRVHQLQIHHDILDPRQHGFKYAPAAIAACFDRAVHPRDAVQRFQQELRLPRRFTAGKGHAAGHCGKIVLVPQKLLGQFLCRIAFSA